MPKPKTIYVAETDEKGAVLCVWVDTDGQRSVRPFNPKRNRLNEFAKAEFSGAQPDAIKYWLRRQQQA